MHASSTEARNPISSLRALVRVALSAFVNFHDLAEQCDRFGLRTLKAVAADDRAVTAAGVDPADGIQQRVVGFLGAARENHDSPAVECSLYDVLDACRERLERNPAGLVRFFGLGLFDKSGGRLDLDHIRTELRR